MSFVLGMEIILTSSMRRLRWEMSQLYIFLGMTRIVFFPYTPEWGVGKALESCTINVMHRRTILLLALVSLTLVSPVQMHVLQLVDGSLTKVRVPAGMQPIPTVMSADFDNDGKAETLTLRDGQAAIQRRDQILWQSPAAWQVGQATIGDLNRDGRPEVVLLVWRPFKPWPVDTWLPHGGRIADFHDSSGRSCHIILIGWYQDAFRERWAGSALADPVKSLAIADLTGNGKQLLVTLEARYDDPTSTPARYLKVWEWNGFGFSLVSSMEGSFSQMVVARAKDSQIMILVP
jgi:hypothetical protein